MNFRVHIVPVFILSLIFQLTTRHSSAQNKSGGVAFFSGSWKAVLEEARKTGKPVMVDMYTTWCLPCKKMDNEVFPLPEVGDKFNQSFICYKVDAEKGEGVGIKEKYEVGAYPTYLFINEDGVLLHTAIGYHAPQDFLKAATEAEKKAKETVTVQSLHQQYENGNREPVFLKAYITKLASLGMQKTQQKLLDEYIAVLPAENLDNIEEMGFVLKNLVTLDSKTFSVILERQPLAARALEQDTSMYTDVNTGNTQTNLGIILSNVALTSTVDAISRRDTSLWNTVSENVPKILHQTPLFPYTFFSFTLQFYGVVKDTVNLAKAARKFLSTDTYFDSALLSQKNQQALSAFLWPYLNGKKDSATAQNFQQLKEHYSRRITIEAARTLDRAAKSYARFISSPQDLQQGIAWSRKAITLVNDDPSFYQTLADLYAKTGHRNNAISNQKTALRIARAQQRDEKEIESYQVHLEALRSGGK